MTEDRILPRAGFILIFILTLAGSLIHAAPFLPNDKLSEFDYLLIGLTVRPEPERQVVPRNIPSGIQVVLEFSDAAADVGALLSLLPTGLEIAAELVGPGIDEPIALRGLPGEMLPIPPLVKPGEYFVRDIRLGRDGEVNLRASPDTATVEVIERVLITQVTTRPLTLEEIRQEGILFGDDDFTGFEFTLALKLDSKPVNIRFPVIFDQNHVPIPVRPTASIDIQGPGAPLPVVNASMVPVMLAPVAPTPEMQLLLAGEPDIRIPGLLLIPGDVGFLNQFFSALLLVSNGAPEGSGLAVSGLHAAIVLPPGDDQDLGTADDPLEIAETASGGQAFELPLLGIGTDGLAGTADDTERFEPGEQGQAEFLLEGRREGFHTISFDIQGVLEGLPVGPVVLHGEASGGVLVRNPFFQMTFSAPATVRKFEEFSLYITVTNISQAIANAVRVSLDQASLSGATLLTEPTQQIDTLFPGDAGVLSFRFRSNQTGQVSASYLAFQGDTGGSTGELRFHLGVGERGIPLSPDTIVLPASAHALPSAVVKAALRILGQAWSIATAPTGSLPEGVTRVSRSVVLSRATELAEAGFRVQLGEPLDRALMSLAFSWVGTAEPGFEEILRETDAGAEFLTAIGISLPDTGILVDFQRDVSQDFSSLPPHLLVGVGSGTGEAPVDWQVEDAFGYRVQAAGSSDLPNGAVVPLSGAGRGIALMGTLHSSFYEARFAGNGIGELDVAVSLPRPDGTTGFYVLTGVAMDQGVQGRLDIDLLNPPLNLRLFLDRNEDGVFEESVNSSAVEILTGANPQILAATAIGPETLSGADPWGRVVALLFDREMREAEANDPSHYQVASNQILSAVRQLSGRLVFLFLRDPVGNLVPRHVTLSGLFDDSGRPMSPASRLITSRLADPGAIVSGRVLQADGTPLIGAEVLYSNTASRGPIGLSLKEVSSDGSYSFDYVRQSPDGPFSIRALDPATGGMQELTTTVRTHGEHIVVDLVLLGRGGVRGTVRDLSGELVPGAEVLVTSQVDPASFFLTETDGQGLYEGSGIVVGPVVVKAVEGSASGTASGAIQRAGTFTNIDVTLNVGAGRVSGRVFELTGSDVLTPVPYIGVYYLLQVPGSFQEILVASGQTGSDGSYVFDQMPTGEFRVLAADPVTGRQASHSGTLVGEGILEDFDLFFTTEPTDFGTIQGHVLDGSGDGVAGALVQGAGRQVETESGGNFLLADIAPGTHNVFAVHPDNGKTASTPVMVRANQVANVTLAFPGSGQVAVTLLDVSGAPLAGQQVIRVSGHPCQGEARTTDGSGLALFDDVGVPGGTFKATRQSDLVQGTATIQRDGDSASLTLQFAGFGTVTGRVLDPDGEPIAGADVVLGSLRLDYSLCAFVYDSSARQVKTAGDGGFVFANVPVGPVSASASSFFFPVPTTAKDVILAAGDTKEFTLTLSSHFAGELHGVVFLPDGETPAGSGVSVTASSSSRPDVTVTTGVDGSFRFAKIFPPGPYQLTATDPVTGRVARRDVALLEEQDLRADLRLLGRGAVVVTVLDGAGEPVEEAFVELERATFPFDQAAAAITPLDEGIIRFEGVSEGEFTVTASDRLGRGGRASAAVPEDGAVTPVTVSLTVTGTVKGIYLTSDGGEPIPNAEVRLRQGTTGRLLGSTTTSSQPGALGRFEFHYVPAGTVLVTAIDPLTGRIGEASGRIETEGELLELEILQLGMGNVSGRVTSGGDPIGGAMVELTSRTGLSSSLANFEATATTGGEGQFVFEGVPVGSFTLKATVTGLLLTGTAEGAITTDGQEVSNIEIELQPSGTVLGTVFRPDATTPVPGAHVTLEPNRGTLRTDTRASGDFRFDFVPVGDFGLRAEETGGGDAGIASGTLSEGEELEVDIVFNGTGTVGGLALDSDGLPLSSPGSSRGMVQINTPEPFPRNVSTAIAEDGSFRFSGIPVGDFSLFLTPVGSVLRGTAMGRISADGETVHIDVQLADSGSILGRVVRSDGETAAPNALVTVSGTGFLLSDLTDSEGAFRIDGIPLGAFTARADDSVTAGVVAVSGSIATNGEEIDLGTLVLDDSAVAVESIVPADGATGVTPDSSIVVRFTDPVKPKNLPWQFAVSSGGTGISAAHVLSTDGLEMTLTPQPWLPPVAEIQVFLSKNLEDTLGRNLGTDFVSHFTTGGAVVTGIVTSGISPVPDADITLVSGDTTLTTRANGEGRYRFTNVPLGTAVIQAVDTSSGLVGSAVVEIGPSDGVKTVDLALAFSGNVTGQVIQAGGSPAGAGLEVAVLQGGFRVGLTTTNESGRYLVTLVPLGDFTVDVTDPLTGDRGRAEGNLSAVGVTVEVDVHLTGIGSVRLFVRDPSGEMVEGAEIFIRFERFGKTTTLSATTPEPDGSYFFPSVLAGPFTAEAVDPSNGLRASGSGTAVAGSEVTVDLVLQPSGSLFGTVFAPDGETPVPDATVEVLRDWAYWPEASQLTDATGKFRFELLPVSEGPYRIDVSVNGRLRARRRGIEIPGHGAEVQVDLVLVGLGTVTGQVLPPPGETLSPSARVDLTSLSPDLGGFFTDTDVSGGTYEIGGVPVGPFKISARDTSRGFLGEAEGEISTDGETVTIDIQLVNNGIDLSSPKTLLDANELRYTIGKNGVLSDGTNGVFNASAWGALNLVVTVDGVTTPFSGNLIGQQEEGGREIVVTAEQEIGGLTVRRKVFVPQKGYFVRHLEIFENPTAEAVSLSASVVSNINDSPKVLSSSNGDDVAEPEDLWIVIDDDSNLDPFETSTSIPSTAWVMAGEGASLTQATVEFEENVGSSDGRFTVSYELTVPPSGRVLLMHFMAQQLTVEAAEAAGERLTALPPEALDGLSLDEIADVANFDVPSDGTSPLAPLPLLNGFVTGQVFAHDGEHTIDGAQVQFQSSHILFRRIRKYNTGANGIFSFAGRFDLNNSVAIPRVDFTLTATKDLWNLKVEASTSGSFLGRSILNRSPDLEASASSGSSYPPWRAFDGTANTNWLSDPGDAFNRGATPWVEMALPASVEVDSIHLDTYVNTSFYDRSEILKARIELLGSAGEVLFETVEDLPEPDRRVDRVLDPPVPGVRRVRMVSLEDIGNRVGVDELEVRGTATNDVGSAYQDLVFAGTSAIAGTTRKANGEGVQSRLWFNLSSWQESRDTAPSGAYFFAPIPPEVSPLNMTAKALWDNPLLIETRTVDLNADVTSLVDITYAETSEVSGRVLSPSGAPVSGISVILYPEGISRTTDSAGFYRFPEVPSGAYDLYVYDPGTARGIYTHMTVVAPNPLTQDIQLPDSGAVEVTVLYETLPGDPIEPVAYAPVLIKDSLQADFVSKGTTNASGQLVIEHVAGGPFIIRAKHPNDGSVFVDSSDTIGFDGEVVSLTVHIPTLGKVTGTVRFADGTAAQFTPVEISGTGVTSRTTSTNNLGIYTFATVEARRPFTILARHPPSNRNHIFSEASGEISGPGGTATVDVDFPPTGTVDVRVTNQDGSPVGNASISILDSFSTEFRPEGITSSSTGRLTITVVPEGAFTVRAELGGKIIGEETAEIVDHGSTVEVTFVIETVDLRNGKQFLDANEAPYTVRKSGSLRGGIDGLFSSSRGDGLQLDLTIDDQTTRFIGFETGTLEDSGREIVIAPEAIGPLTVQRKVYVPTEGYFARHLEILENTSAEPITFSASVLSELYSYSTAPQVVATSSGDDLADPEDFWLVTDDETDEDPFETYTYNIPSTAWVLADGGASLAPASVDFEVTGSREGRLTVSYELSLSAGGRIVLMHFVSQQLKREAAAEAAFRLSSLAPEAIAGLSADEVSSIANFEVPEDGTSPLAPLPPLDGFVGGRLLAHDGIHPIGYSSQTPVNVQFQSDHMLFRRIRRATNDNGGSFRFQSSFTTNTNLAIPRTDFTLTAAPYEGALSSATASASAGFTGRSNFSHAPGAKPSSSSQSGESYPEKATDGNTSTYWQPASGDANPTWGIEIPSPVDVDTLRVLPGAGANLSQVTIDFLGISGEVLDSLVESFDDPDGELEVSLPIPVAGVKALSFRFTGSPIRVAEIDVIGDTTIDLGSRVQDLVFEGTSAISGTTRKVSGEAVSSSLSINMGGTPFQRSTDFEGAYFFAPIPSSIGSVIITATARNSLLKKTVEFSLFPDTTTGGDIYYDVTSEVSGRALFASGTPVTNRSIDLLAENGLSAYRATDSNGYFLFQDVPSGNHVLRLHFYSTRTVDVPITVEAPTPLIQDIQVPALGTVNLTVYFDTPEGVPPMTASGASVSIRDSLDTAYRNVGSTNSSGKKSITNVAEGPFTVRVTHPSRSTIVIETTAAIAFDGQVIEMSAILPALGTVSGMVRFGSGSPAGGSGVEISGADITPQATTTKTYDPNKGTYSLTGVEAFHPFTLVARHPVYGRTHIFSQAVGEVSGQGVIATVDITLPKTGSVEVTVEEEGFGPLPGAQVRIRDSFMSDFRYEGVTGSTGTRTITFVPEGAFTVEAESDGILLERTGEIVQDGSIVGVSIVFPARAHIEGRVLADDGETPIPGAPVELRSEDGSSWKGSTTSDEAGSFRFDRALNAGQSRRVRAYFPGDSTIMAEAAVTASEPGETISVDLLLPVSSKVKGKVLEADGLTPVAGTLVEIRRTGSFFTHATVTDANGDFVFVEVPDTYELVAEDSFGLVRRARVEIAEGEERIQDIVLPESGTVEGTVTDALGGPLADTPVVLRNANLRAARAVLPEANGSFRFERVALGAFSLTYDHPTEAGEPPVTIPGSTVGRLSEPGETMGAHIVVPDVGTVFGQVLSSGGVPIVPGPYTYMILEGRQHESTEEIYNRTTQILSDGSYLQEGVPVGELRVNVRDLVDGGSATGTIVAGAETEVNVSLGSALRLPADLGMGFLEELDRRGATSVRGVVIDEHGNTEDIKLGVVSTNTKRFPDISTAEREASGQILFGPISTSGLLHTRKVFVPEDRRFIRYLDVLENPHPLDIEVTMVLSGTNMSALSTSSGDERLDSNDRYITTYGENTLEEVVNLAHVFGGTGEVMMPEAFRGAWGHYELEWRRISVPAGSRVILLHFVVLSESTAEALERADLLMKLADPNAFSDLSAEERSDVLNFVVP